MCNCLKHQIYCVSSISSINFRRCLVDVLSRVFINQGCVLILQQLSWSISRHIIDHQISFRYTATRCLFVCALVVYYSLKVGLVGHMGSSLSIPSLCSSAVPPSVIQHLVQNRLLPAQTCSGCHAHVHLITVSALQPTLHLANQRFKPTS